VEGVTDTKSVFSAAREGVCLLGFFLYFLDLATPQALLNSMAVITTNNGRQP
jgi:hypothetical protein